MRLRISNRAYKIIESQYDQRLEMMKLDLMAMLCTRIYPSNKKIALEGVIRELRKLLNKTIFEDLIGGLAYKSPSNVHIRKRHMNFVTRSLCLRSNSNKLLYPLHSALLLCLRSLMSFPSLSPFIFVHFFLFLFKSPIVSCTEHNGHYLCFNDLNCEEQRHEKKKNLQPTIITTSCGYSVVVYYCVCCTFMLLCIAYPFCPQIIDIPLKGTGVLVPIY